MMVAVLLLGAGQQVEYRGLTGPVQFREGRRASLKLDLLKLKSHELAKVGQWNEGSGINITDPVAFFDTANMNITLIVTTNLVMRTSASIPSFGRSVSRSASAASTHLL